jgi:DNA-binding NarL/FixJ family response regulator
MGAARFLVVEDEPLVVRGLVRLVRRHGEAVVAGTAREADLVLAEAVRWCGWIIDIGLPDGSGLDVLARARPRHPQTPALVQTGNLEAALVNRAYDLRADYVVKSQDPERVRRFVRESSAAMPLPGISLDFAAGVEQIVQAWTSQDGLSDAEADILRRAALGEDRAAIGKARNCSQQTINKHVVNLLRRTRDRTLHAATERLLREVARGTKQ